MRGEITPKNILMIGPTGVGKTEIARRLARAGRRALHQGRGDQVHRGRLRRQGRRLDHPRPGRHGGQAGARDARCAGSAPAPRTPPRSASSRSSFPGTRAEFGLAPSPSADNTARQVMRKRLREGALDDKEIEIEVAEAKPSLEIMGPAGMEEMTEQLRGMFANLGGAPQEGAQAEDRRGAEAARSTRKPPSWSTTTRSSRARSPTPSRTASSSSTRSTRSPRARRRRARDVSRQGVQRDLLPLVEGTTVNTKYGMVKTDHILFIASGAFHLSQAERPDPRAAGALPDPGRARLALGRRLRGDPDADPRQPGQAVHAAARDRGRHAGARARGDPPHRADRLRRQRAHREHRRAAAVDGDGAAARRGQLRRAEPRRADDRRAAVDASWPTWPGRGPLALHPDRADTARANSVFTELAMKQASCASWCRRSTLLSAAPGTRPRMEDDEVIATGAHHAGGRVGVAVDAKARARGEVEEPEHVAARQRRDERLLRIDRGGIGVRQRHDVGRRRAGHLDAAVEAQPVAAAVAPVDEVFAAGIAASPDRLCGVVHRVRLRGARPRA